MVMAGVSGLRGRYYVRETRLPFGEDRCREFKGHRNMAHEEVPERFIRTRRAVSRNINGFLNTGLGGRIYLGILDDGTVKGLRLSEAQKEHMVVSLTDLMGRYNPRVSRSKYKLQFVPAVEEWEVDTKKKGVRMGSSEAVRVRRGEGRGGEGEEDSGVGMDGSEGEYAGEKVKGHLLRTSKRCWCDRETALKLRKGMVLPYYVIEITILPFTHDPTLPAMVLQLYPVYENEQGKCFFRGSTSLAEYSYQQVAELTIEEAHTHFEKVKEKLRQDMKTYQELLTSALVMMAKTAQQLQPVASSGR